MAIDPIQSGAPVERVFPVAPRSLQGSSSPEVATPPSGRDRFAASVRTPLDADRRLAALGSGETDSVGSKTGSTDGAAPDGSKSGRKDGATTDGSGLTGDERREVKELERRDAEVRAHEQAHLAAAGGLAEGGPKFSFASGPDGKRYATGGEVGIAMRTGSTPEETIRNAQRVQAAAMAPGDPSPTDQQTAAAAARMAQQTRQELSAKSVAGTDGAKGSATADPAQASSTRASGSSPHASTGGRVAARQAAFGHPRASNPAGGIDSHAAQGRE